MIRVAFAKGSNTRLVVMWKDEPAEQQLTPEAYDRAPDLLFSALGIGPQTTAPPNKPRRRRPAQSTQSSPESR